MTSASPDPRFGTILSARSNQSPPNELEVRLRTYCRRLKVVSNQLNGAHLVLPPASSGEATLAVRVYYAETLPSDVSSSSALEEMCKGKAEDLDGLEQFRRSFALTIVFFVLSEKEKSQQLANMGSFVRRAMHRLTIPCLGSSPSLPTASSNTTRVLLVPSSDAAIQALVTFADALAPAKRQLKQAFFEQQRQVNFLPPAASDAPASLRVLKALREWAFCNNVAEHEIDIVVYSMGNLETIVQHSATGLKSVPISQRTKTLLHQFFHGHPSPRQALPLENIQTSHATSNFSNDPLPALPSHHQHEITQTIPYSHAAEYNRPSDYHSPSLHPHYSHRHV